MGDEIGYPGISAAGARAIEKASWRLVPLIALGYGSAYIDRQGERTWHIAVPFLPMGAGYLVGGLVDRPWIAVPALGVAAVAFSALQGPMLMQPSTFFSGKTSALGYAALHTVGIAGGFIGPVWMGWARDLTGDYRRRLLFPALPSIAAAGLVLGIASVRRLRGERKAS